MYVAGFVIPVPEENLEAYRGWAEASAAVFRSYGCLEIVEAWEDEVPDGKTTDFRRAVAARPGERIVFGWQVWPDKASMKAVEAAMATDPRFEIEGEVPFDAGRLIYGGFAPIFTTGRDGEAQAGAQSSDRTVA